MCFWWKNGTFWYFSLVQYPNNNTIFYTFLQINGKVLSRVTITSKRVRKAIFWWFFTEKDIDFHSQKPFFFNFHFFILSIVKGILSTFANFSRKNEKSTTFSPKKQKHTSSRDLETRCNNSRSIGSSLYTVKRDIDHPLVRFYTVGNVLNNNLLN